MSTPAAAAISTPAAPAAAPATASPSSTPTPAANEPYWSSWVKPEQTEERTWLQNKNYPDPATLVKSARTWESDAATLRAAKGYPVADAAGKVDDNQMRAWKAATGVPETADKYEIPVDSANPYPQFKTYMAEEFLSAGVPAAMASRLAKGYESVVAKLETEMRAQEDSRSQAAMVELERAWGQNYQERMQFAARGKAWLTQEAGGLNDMQLRVLEGVLGTDKFLTAMWKLGAGNGEARFPPGNPPPGNFGSSASDAQSRMDQIMADRSANKITDAQFRELQKPGGELDQLRDRIVAGYAQH